MSDNYRPTLLSTRVLQIESKPSILFFRLWCYLVIKRGQTKTIWTSFQLRSWPYIAVYGGKENGLSVFSTNKNKISLYQNIFCCKYLFFQLVNHFLPRETHSQLTKHTFIYCYCHVMIIDIRWSTDELYQTCVRCRQIVFVIENILKGGSTSVSICYTYFRILRIRPFIV